MLAACDEVIVAQSCDKNFSVYRDRVGSLWIKTRLGRSDRDGDGPRVPDRARNVVDAARSWRRLRSRIVLDDPELRERWLVELDAMRDRINSVRQRIAAADPRLAFIGRQFGMFSMLPLSQGAGARSCATTMRSTWPTAGASTSSAWATTQIDRFTAAVVEALDA